VVALTKADAVDAEMRELAADEVRELLASTALAGAPVLPVSSLTGDGIDALRQALAELAVDAAPRTPRAGPPRLSIDRGFEMKGFGGVATGTLIGAALSVGDVLRVYPTELSGRIRGLQAHGEAVQRIEPGGRCAVNVQGVPLPELSRGRVLAPPERLAPTRLLDVQLCWLDTAPDLTEAAAVELLTGTSERRARVAPIGAERIAAGSVGFARLHIDGDPLVALPGDRFILRGFARTAMGGATLAGGSILDVAPPHRRRSDPALLRDLEQLLRGQPALDLAVRVRRAGLSGVSDADLCRETGWDAQQLAKLAGQTRGDDAVSATRDHRLVGEAALASLETRLLDALDAYHRSEPLRPGMPTGTLRRALPENVPTASADLALERLAARQALLVSGDHVRRPDHRPQLDPQTRKRSDQIAALLAKAGLEAPSLRDLARAVDSSPGALGDLLAHLEREGRLVRAPGELWFDAGAVEALRERLREHFRSHETLDTPTYKSIIGTTRRTAVPLMELLDTQRFTTRRGEVRVLRKT